jgi:hypothetical protein
MSVVCEILEVAPNHDITWERALYDHAVREYDRAAGNNFQTRDTREQVVADPRFLHLIEDLRQAADLSDGRSTPPTIAPGSAHDDSTPAS